MKKLVTFFMLCVMCTVFIVPASGGLYAYENPSVYNSGGSGSGSPGGGGGGGDIGPGLLGGACDGIINMCKGWLICKFLDGVWTCVKGGDPDGSNVREAAVCLCSNDEECYQKCSCGFESSGKGPVTFKKHNCVTPAN